MLSRPPPPRIRIITQYQEVMSTYPRIRIITQYQEVMSTYPRIRIITQYQEVMSTYPQKFVPRRLSTYSTKLPIGPLGGLFLESDLSEGQIIGQKHHQTSRGGPLSLDFAGHAPRRIGAEPGFEIGSIEEPADLRAGD